MGSSQLLAVSLDILPNIILSPVYEVPGVDSPLSKGVAGYPSEYLCVRGNDPAQVQYSFTCRYTEPFWFTFIVRDDRS